MTSAQGPSLYLGPLCGVDGIAKMYLGPRWEGLEFSEAK